MKFKIPFLIFIFYTLLISPVSASTCEEMISQINADSIKNTTTASHQNFPWQKLSWLEKNLGPAKKTLSPANQTQYTWYCQSNPNVFLTVSIDQAGTVIKFNGEYSNATGGGLFSGIINQNQEDSRVNSPPPRQPSGTMHSSEQDNKGLVSITSTPIEPDNKDLQAISATLTANDANVSLEQATINFKKWFGVDVTKDKIKTVALKMLADYYKKLQSCTPGTYKYPVINNFFGMRQSDNKLQSFADLGIATIQGFKNGKCFIIMGSEESANEGTCELTQDSLNFLVDKTYASGMSSSFRTVDDLNKFARIMTKECTENKR